MRQRGRGLATSPHAEAKKRKSLTFLTHSFLRDSLNHCSSEDDDNEYVSKDFRGLPPPKPVMPIEYSPLFKQNL